MCFEVYTLPFCLMHHALYTLHYRRITHHKRYKPIALVMYTVTVALGVSKFRLYRRFGFSSYKICQDLENLPNGLAVG